jgi:hypothetical protein
MTATTRSVRKEIKDGFTAVPKGCFIQLERKAKEYILDNIRASFGVRAGLVSRIATFEEDAGKPLSLENFTEYYHLDVRNIYARGCFSRLCVLANTREDFNEPLEDVLTKALPKICAIDSRRWILFLLHLLDHMDTADFTALSPVEAAMLRMFYATIWQDSAEELTANQFLDNFSALSKSTVMLSELKELLIYNYNHIDFIDEPVEFGFDCPLDLHCSYTRDQILLALGFMKPATVREGVKWLPERQSDVFFVTLNKSDKEYSPTTMYEDYSINEWMFHWQSQSTTSEESPTGQRYIHHKERRSNVLIFVREYRTDAAGTAPYTFLGMADYMKHEGSRPMSITWRLRRPIPAKYLKKTNKLVIG